MSKATVKKAKSRSILELSADRARKFLLKQESYCSLDLPPYFQFTKLLKDVVKALEGKKLSDLKVSDKSLHPHNHDDVNHLVITNKDGRHAWRPMELIHPALYVSLVKTITEPDAWKLIRKRFKEFAKNKNIKCLSIPRESLTDEKDKASQVTHWWLEVEQQSIFLSLNYEHVVHSDITDCYGAIYTHSIAWALHTKSVAKAQRRDKDLIGNVIDGHMQDMRHGQTNGIPQGSALMDFIAEMVLGYADLLLTEKIDEAGILDYQILRYRDDCRIFVKHSQDGERILKCLTEVMIELGLKLQPAKTKCSDDVIQASVKENKRRWVERLQWGLGLQKRLLVIHSHGMEYPNSGSLVKALGDFRKRIANISKYSAPLPMISIVVDIAYRNPRTYPICVAILSRLLRLLEEDEKATVIESIKRKFSLIPNTGHMLIWLQRITWPFDPDMEFDEPLCRLASGENEL